LRIKFYLEKLRNLTKKTLIIKTALETESNRFIENVKYYIERYIRKMYTIQTKVIFS